MHVVILTTDQLTKAMTLPLPSAERAEPALSAATAPRAAGRQAYLLDGMALVYRGYFAMIKNPPRTATGLNTSAPFVFTSTLLEIMDKRAPTHMAVAFDTPTPTYRHEAFPAYKAQRDSMPDDLSVAMPYIFRLCEGFNLPIVRLDGWEADDTIGTLAKLAEAEGIETFMVTPDKDFAQLVSDRTFIYKPARAGGEAEVIGVEDVLAKWKIERIDQVIDVLALMGDSVDNIPGVPGIGEKTAQKLIADFGSIENLLEHVAEVKGKRREILEANRAEALLSKRLVTIQTNAPVQCGMADLERRPFDEEALKQLFAELEFNMFGKRLFGAGFEARPRVVATTKGTDGGGEESVQQELALDLQTIESVAHDYQLVWEPEARKALLTELQRRGSFCFDLETSGLDPKSCEILGVAVSYEAHSGYYLPCADEKGPQRDLLEELRPIFENPQIEKIGHNLKFDLLTLVWHGIEVKGKLFDTMIAAFLAAPDLRRSLDYLSQAMLGYKPVPISALIGEKGAEQRPMADVPLDELTEYAVEDADITLQLSVLLREMLEEKNQVELYEKAEYPLIPVLAAMERAGIRVDAAVLRGLSEEMDAQIETAARHIEELAGEPFNLNSPSQLGMILFDKLKLDPQARRTQKSKQYKTDELVLTRLSHEHEIARQILDYRLCTKLKSTYLDMLPGAIFPKTGRIHTYYEQAVAATGRMQSSNPNLQNIPIRTERGREIRKAFVPGGDEFTLLTADYSQIELRVIAEISGDERMNRAFRTGEDIHTVTACRVHGVAPEEVTEDMRRKSKTINFGIIYGISAFGLSERLGLPRGMANDMIEQYFEEYPGVRDYMDKTIAFCREHGYVETLMGRRRYLRDIDSRSAAVRKAAERNAINSPIQGTAADMIKLAMVSIHKSQVERGWKTKMLLQVHDELVFDLHRDEEEEVKEVVANAMVTAIPMSVPIEVELGTGDNWLEAH